MRLNGWETILAIAAAGAARASMSSDAYGAVTGELVTLLGIIMAAFIPTMLLAATTLRAGRFSTSRILALSGALDRQIAVFGGLFLYALLACLLVIAGKMANWHLFTLDLRPLVDRRINWSPAFATAITGLLTFIALRSLALIDGIRSLLRLSSTMAIDEAGEKDEQRLVAEKADIDRRGKPTAFRDPVATGVVTHFE